MPSAWADRNCARVGPERLGAGSSPQDCRIDHTVEGAHPVPEPGQLATDHAVPQVKLSTAKRLTNTQRPEGSGGRPGARCGLVVGRRATKRRCQSRIVPGIASIPTRRDGGSLSRPMRRPPPDPATTTAADRPGGVGPPADGRRTRISTTSFAAKPASNTSPSTRRRANRSTCATPSQRDHANRAQRPERAGQRPAPGIWHPQDGTPCQGR
jgi:hypothetical protein